MTTYRWKSLCRSLNISYFEVKKLNASEEANLYLTPDKEYFEEIKRNRERNVFVQLHLAQLWFQDDEARNSYTNEIFDILAGPKFIDHHINPYTRKPDA